MGFIQEKKNNLDVWDFCQGCDEHCKLGEYHEVRRHGSEYVLHVWPAIDGKKIETYINNDGVLVNAEQFDRDISKDYDPYYLYRIAHNRVINETRKIATLCDKYKTR